MKKIQYTVARDKDNNVITALDAVVGGVFKCIDCNNVMSVRGNTTDSPYFVHKVRHESCTPEKSLHIAFKNSVAAKIESYINSQQQVSLSWLCRYCQEKHQGNLLKKIRTVECDHDLNGYKPDITLLDIDKRVFAVMEFSINGSPKDEIIQYCKTNGIIFINIALSSGKDIYDVDLKISQPDFVDFCFNPKCKTCGNYKQKSKFTIITGACYKCHADMKVAVVDRESGICGPENFTDDELRFCQSKGAIIKMQFSKTMNQSYYANTCGSCGAFAGQFHLFTDYYNPAYCDGMPFETHEYGLYCGYCQG